MGEAMYRTGQIPFILVLVLSLCSTEMAYSKTDLYISPGIQLGYGFGKGFFWEGQITIGDIFQTDRNAGFFIPGITFGLSRYYLTDQKLMRYIDFQIGTLNGMGGLGFGRMKIKSSGNNEWVKGKRFKLWAGCLGLVTYDNFTIPNNDIKHSLGIMGVLPFTEWGGPQID